jgi:protein-tyrosine-phosphatase
MKKVSLDVSAHRSRAITEELVRGAVAVFGMTESHRAMIQFAMTPVPRNLYLFREFMPQRGLKEIGDPYGGALKLYESTRDEMVEAIPSLIEFIKTQISAKPAR